MKTLEQSKAAIDTPRLLLSSTIVVLFVVIVAQEYCLINSYKLTSLFHAALRLVTIHSLLSFLSIQLYLRKPSQWLISAGWFFLFGPLLLLLTVALVETSGLRNLYSFIWLGPSLTLFGWFSLMIGALSRGNLRSLIT